MRPLVHQPHHKLGKAGVVVGLSGGVDSSVAAILLQDQGYRVVGVTLKLPSEDRLTDEPACCSPEALERAEAVAHHLGIPHLVVDARVEFSRDVVDYFVDEYGRGCTPNPCAKCNARVRFPFLIEVARKLGAARIATGHYARLTGEPPRLSRGADCSKDQSYVLAEVAPHLLQQAIFPLGGMTKGEVREIARLGGLESQIAPESQEICFVPGDDYRAFLKSRLGERGGHIVDMEGRLLGRHSGTYNFTVGQRKGLGIPSSEPLYVVAVDSERAEVTVGPYPMGTVETVRISRPLIHRAPCRSDYTLQFRSAGRPVPAQITREDAMSLSLHEPTFGVAPGQTAVLYDGDDVVLAGRILSTEPWDPQLAESRAGGRQ
jgi:tRNA-specific 2-thiouridylase